VRTRHLLDDSIAQQFAFLVQLLRASDTHILHKAKSECACPQAPEKLRRRRNDAVHHQLFWNLAELCNVVAPLRELKRRHERVKRALEWPWPVQGFPANRGSSARTIFTFAHGSHP